tara:strand:- start:106 stop:2088 length:1983 start_codon:yes stop_codon:yes gene_type:complete|mmetsp:Transcript_5088/g.19038  ORF Transcript_5088/g.19038 Transcript_5088/m.19038 type:complete len:661 (+) Transcript_5088:376-2358(+)
MFTSAHPRATPSAPLDLPHGNASTRERSRLSRTAPEARHHSSLLAALQEEDTDDDEISANSVSDDDGFPFASLTLDESRGGSALHTPRGSHRLVTTKDSTESPTSPLVTHKTHSKTYGFAPPSGGAAASTPFADAFTDVPGTSSLLPSLDMFTDDDPSVTVKMRGVKDLEVTLRKNETAASLKLKLEQLRPNQYPRDFGGLGLRDPQAAGSLFFGSQELRDGPLNHYGVADGATLELRPHGNGFANAGGGISIPNRSLRERHSWNAAGHWKPHAVANAPAGSDWSASANASGGGGGGWSGFGDGASSASSSERGTYGSPEVARSFDLARRGLAMGNRPTLANSGTGGAYFLKGSDGETCAVFKPADEEPNAKNNPRGRNVGNAAGEGLRKGTRVGEGASREVAAYLLDHESFAAVPATSLANLCATSTEQKDTGKLGSLQAFVRADAEAEELGPGLFPVHEVHKITQLDIRIANTDRNAGNILVRKTGGGLDGTQMFLVPIDHGYALPHTLEDVCFEWEFWPQAKIPYDAPTKAYIASLDVEVDLTYLKSEGIDLAPASQRVLRVCTLLLQKAAHRGCCPADIAGMMSRPMPNRLSDLEKLVSRAATAALAAQGASTPPTTVADPWQALAGNADAETKFLVEFCELLDSYLEGFEPEMTL